MRNKKVTMIPLVLCEVYWIMSYIIYRFGVMEHPFKKDIWAAIFVGACNLFFGVGYIWIVRYRKKTESVACEYSINIAKFLWFAIIVSIIIAIPNSIRYTGDWYPHVITALKNPGEVYLRVINNIFNSTAINWIALFDFFPFVIFPLIYFYWDRLEKKIKIIGCAVTAYYLAIYCSCGRNMPITYFAFSVVITYFVILCSGIQKNRKEVIRNVVIALVMLTLATVMFKVNLESRTLYSTDVEEELNLLEATTVVTKTGNDDVFLQYKDLIITNEQKEACERVAEIFPMYTNPYTKSYVKTDDPIYRFLPESMRFIYVMGSSYLSSSYHVLSVAMRMDFEWTYGMGNSQFLMDYFNRFTGININERTYGYRSVNLTEPSIVSTYGWPTSYVQFASDLTFPGVIVLFFVLGMLTSIVWIEVTSTRNVLGVPLLIEMALLCLFVPANCITFGSGGYFTIFFGSLVLFLMSLFWARKKAKADMGNN